MARAAASRSAPGSPSADTRFLILHGKDRFLMDEHLHALRQSLAKAHGPDIDTVRFDGAQGARILADVLDECRSRGLMQQFKIVFVDNADALVRADDAPAAPAHGRKRAVSARELLETYAEAPSDSAVLVLRAETWRPGNLDKAVIAGGGLVLKCEPLPEEQAIAWAMDRAKLHQTAIDRAAASRLVNAIGTDRARLDTELEKLALAAGGKGKPITDELIGSLVGTTREEEFWAIQSVLLVGDAAAALAQLRDLVEVSRHDPVPITFSFVDMARKVHIAAHALAEGASEGRIMGALKLWGPGAQQMARAVMDYAGGIGPRRAVQLLDAAIRVDAANKSGSGEPVRNLERLALRFAALGRIAKAGATR